jgi:AraC-like DNA-binding protein
MSRTGLNRWFVGHYGTPAGTYLKQRQIEKAKHLLIRTNLSTTQIGYESAFGTRRAFYRAFLRLTGTTPGEYRQYLLSLSQ